MRRNSYFRNIKRSAADSENPYWVSFSDIMAGLLAVFILALILLMIRQNQQAHTTKTLREQVKRALAELANIEEERREILNAIKEKLKERGVNVEVAENNTVLRIPEQLSFESGRYYIPPEKKQTVKIIGEELKKELLKPGRTNNINTIFIEGHTDSMRYDRAELGNWGLSAHRAISIWKFWTEDPGELIEFAAMKNKEGKHIFSVSGYSLTRRIVVPDDTQEDRVKNRRIDIRFTMRTPVSGELQNLLNKLKK